MKEIMRPELATPTLARSHADEYNSMKWFKLQPICYGVKRSHYIENYSICQIQLTPTPASSLFGHHGVHDDRLIVGREIHRAVNSGIGSDVATRRRAFQARVHRFSRFD
jgi:hypothetical protein